MKLLFIVAFSTLLTACSLPPKPSDLEGVPVITYGQKIPAGKNFILYFKAGNPIRTHVKIHGSLFEKDASSVLTVKLKNDLYAYKNWVSSDRKKWVDGDSTLGAKVLVKIPGPDYPKPGVIDLHLYEK